MRGFAKISPKAKSFFSKMRRIPSNIKFAASKKPIVTNEMVTRLQTAMAKKPTINQIEELIQEWSGARNLLLSRTLIHAKPQRYLPYVKILLRRLRYLKKLIEKSENAEIETQRESLRRVLEKLNRELSKSGSPRNQ